MSRIVRIALLALLVVIAIASPVLAYAYRASYVIEETGGNAYPMLAILESAGNTWMAANDFMEPDALDTRVETLGGVAQPHMVADDKTLTAVSVPANSQTNLYFTTGSADLPSGAMDIITGYDGFVTRGDLPALEPGADFILEQKGWVDVSAATVPGSKLLTYKESALNVVNGAAGSITSGIVSSETFALTHVANGAYGDVDVSALVPSTATGVLLEVMSTTGTPRLCAFRKNGGTDDLYYLMTHSWVLIGLDANKVFEVKEVAGGDLAIYLRAYFYGSGITFNTDASADLAVAAGGWNNADVSAITPVGTVGVILEYSEDDIAVRAAGLRKNGSTDNRLNEINQNSHFFAVVGVDAARIFQYYATDNRVKIKVIGYIISGASFDTNATDKSITGAGAWKNITGLTANTWSIFEVVGNATTYDYGFRRNGSIEDRYQENDSQRAWAIAPTDANGVLQAEISNNAQDFFKIGYLDSTIIGATYPTYTYSAQATVSGLTSGEKTITTTGYLNHPVWATGNVLHFDGTANSYVNCGAIYNATNILYHSFWFKPDVTIDATLPANAFLFGKLLNGNNFVDAYFAAGSGVLVFQQYTGGVNDFVLNSVQNSWTANTWYHILVSTSTVVGARMRINGGVAVTNIGSSAICNGGNFVVGDITVGTGAGIVGNIQNYIVVIDDLTLAEETALYNGTAPGDETDYWYIDEGTGNTIYSYGSAPNNGTRGAATAWQTATYTTGQTGRLCDYTLQVVSGATTTRVGDNLESAGALAGVPPTDAMWQFMLNNVMPYADYIRETTVAGEVLEYMPASMIIGTALPDTGADGVAQDGVITWGVNPLGIDVTLGGMVSGSQPTPGTAITDPTKDILPETNVSDWYVDPAVGVGGSLLTNPLRPFVTLLSDNSTLTEIQAWRLYALAMILMLTVGAARAVKGHLLLAGIAAGASIGGAVALTIFPLWTLIFAIGAVVGGVVAERSPSL